MKIQKLANDLQIDVSKVIAAAKAVNVTGAKASTDLDSTQARKVEEYLSAPPSQASAGAQSAAGATNLVYQSKDCAVDLGEQVYSLTRQVGQSAAPFIRQRAVDGLFDGLSDGVGAAGAFDSVSLQPDPDFFEFPQLAGT